MNNFLVVLYKSRLLILALMVFSAVLNSVRFYGEWGDFYTVVLGQLWFGQGFYAYIRGGRIVLVGGGAVGKDAHPAARGLVGGGAFMLYILMFFW